MAVMKKAVAPRKTERVNERIEGLKTKKALADLRAKAASKKPSAMGQSAKAHQASLAKISGTTAAMKAGKSLPKAGRNEAVAGRNAKVTIAAYSKATKKTAASFKKSK